MGNSNLFYKNINDKIFFRYIYKSKLFLIYEYLLIIYESGILRDSNSRVLKILIHYHNSSHKLSYEQAIGILTNLYKLKLKTIMYNQTTAIFFVRQYNYILFLEIENA